MQISGKNLLVGVSLEDIEDLATENPSLRGYLQGYVAEMFLKRKLAAMSELSEVEKIRDHDAKKGDFQFMYKGRELTIEVKSLKTASVKEDLLNGGWVGTVQVGASDSRTIEDGTSTKCLERGQFDILAISAFAIGQGWDFYFIANKYLPSSNDYPDRIKTSFVINTANTPCLHTDLMEVLEDLTG
jgi:hypothetical protein